MTTPRKNTHSHEKRSPGAPLGTHVGAHAPEDVEGGGPDDGVSPERTLPDHVWLVVTPGGAYVAPDEDFAYKAAAERGGVAERYVPVSRVKRRLRRFIEKVDAELETIGGVW